MKSFKLRALSLLSVATLFLSTSPLALAVDEEEAPASDPVWVLSYAAFILFSAATIMLCIFFSKRRDSMLDVEDQKKVAKVRAERATKRRKEEQLARMHAQKKH